MRTHLGLPAEPAEEVLPDDDVERDRHLVEEEDLEGPHEPQEELHAAALWYFDGCVGGWGW